MSHSLGTSTECKDSHGNTYRRRDRLPPFPPEHCVRPSSVSRRSYALLQRRQELDDVVHLGPPHCQQDLTRRLGKRPQLGRVCGSLQASLRAMLREGQRRPLAALWNEEGLPVAPLGVLRQS
jgi:hypothetical protein